MKKTAKTLLGGAAVFGQLLAMLPFAAAFCAYGKEEIRLLPLAAAMLTVGVFYAAGFFCAKAAKNVIGSRKKKKTAFFLSRAAVILPAAALIILIITLGIATFAYVSVLPAGITAFVIGHRTSGLSYNQKFKAGSVIMYLISGIVTEFLVWTKNDEQLLSETNLLLCGGFAALSILSAILANQSAIDGSTRQRGGDRALLPAGLRLRNALTVGGISVLLTGLFLLAKPIAEVLTVCVQAVARAIIFMLDQVYSCITDVSGANADQNAGQGKPLEFHDAFDWTIVYVILTIALIIAIFKFRGEIAARFKELFAPLFKINKEKELPFYDEIITTENRPESDRARMKAIRLDLAKYRRETLPDRKYRLGYEIFMRALNGTKYAPVPSDSTGNHLFKGGRAFSGAELHERLREQKAVYDRLRYGEAQPSPEELSRQEILLKLLLNR